MTIKPPRDSSPNAPTAGAYADCQIGANIRCLRRSAGMSQADLATAAGIGSTPHSGQLTVHKIESGTRRLQFSEAILIADVFGISLDDLAGRARPLDHQAQLRWQMLNALRDAADRIEAALIEAGS